MAEHVSSKRSSVASSDDTVNNKRQGGGAQKITLFNTYIHKLSRKVVPVANISKASCMQLDSFIKIFSEQLATLTIKIAHGFCRHTITAQDVQTAVQILLPASMQSAAIEFAEQKVQTFENNGKDGKMRNKAFRSDLCFPPHLAEKYLRMQNSAQQNAISKLSVSETAPVYFAAVTEYIVHQILSGAAAQTHAHKRQTINIRYLFLGTSENAGIVELMKKLNVNWLGGGVVAEIHPALLPNKEHQRKLALKRRKARLENGETPLPVGSRKALPGKTAMRNIRRLQKSFGALQRKEHFKRFIREQADVLWNVANDKVHMAAGVIEYLQLYVEDKVTAFVKDAVNAMVHANRETIDIRDIDLVRGFTINTNEPINEAGIDNLAVPGIYRITLRGGAKRVAISCYQELRKLMAYYTSQILRPAFLLMRRQNIKTLSLLYLRRGAELAGINLTVDASRSRKFNKQSVSDSPNSDGEEEEDDVVMPETDVVSDEDLEKTETEDEAEEEEEVADNVVENS